MIVSQNVIFHNFFWAYILMSMEKLIKPSFENYMNFSITMTMCPFPNVQRLEEVKTRPEEFFYLLQHWKSTSLCIFSEWIVNDCLTVILVKKKLVSKLNKCLQKNIENCWSKISPATQQSTRQHCQISICTIFEHQMPIYRRIFNFQIFFPASSALQIMEFFIRKYLSQFSKNIFLCKKYLFYKKDTVFTKLTVVTNDLKYFIQNICRLTDVLEPL